MCSIVEKGVFPRAIINKFDTEFIRWFYNQIKEHRPLVAFLLKNVHKSHWQQDMDLWQEVQQQFHIVNNCTSEATDIIKDVIFTWSKKIVHVLGKIFALPFAILVRVFWHHENAKEIAWWCLLLIMPLISITIADPSFGNDKALATMVFWIGACILGGLLFALQFKND